MARLIDTFWRKVGRGMPLLAVWPLALAPASTIDVQPERAAQARQLQRALVGMTTLTHAPGGVMLVANGGSVWRGATGLAVKRPRQPMRVDRRFRIASVTKPFVATVVLQLVAEGRLRLDNTVERWLPGAVPGGSSITLRHLLSHTSGLVDQPFVQTAELGKFSYANRNWTLLGAIVEAATGSPVAQEVERRIVQPLGLRDTAWPATATLLPRLAHGYTPVTGSDATTAATPCVGAPSCALVSSAADLRRFLDALFGGRLLPEALVDAMRVPVEVGPRYTGLYDGYGLGLMKIEAPCGTAWGHRGRVAGYTSYAFASADGRRRIVVLLNVGEPDDDTIVRLNGLVFAAFCA
jgi:D-alanyl-D-alanine carboxypeptidase